MKRERYNKNKKKGLASTFPQSKPEYPDYRPREP
jgi:hypothetical protein